MTALKTRRLTDQDGWSDRRGAKRAYGSRLFWTYAVASFVPITLLGIFLARDYAAVQQRDALAEIRERALAVAHVAIYPKVAGPGPRDSLTNNERRELQAGVEQLRLSGVALGVRVLRLDGSTVFVPASYGNRMPDWPAGFSSAAAGHASERILRPSNMRTPDSRSLMTPWIAQVYVPVRSGPQAPVTAVAVVDVDCEPALEQMRAGLQRMYAALAVGLLTLYVTLGAISASVTGRLRREASQNAYLAMHDPLTGLPNRALFADRAATGAQHARRTFSGFALVVVDLDKFKEVNDSFGHASGDAVIATVAARLRRALREIDTVARLGGDEFGLLLPGVTTADEVILTLSRVRDLLEEDLMVEGTSLRSEASMGVALYPDHGTEVTELLKRADVAMYLAKTSRRGVVVHSSAGTETPSRLSLVSELRHALDSDELVLDYQPKFDVRGGAVRSLEALVRWQHPTRGLLYPDDFVPVAEESWLITPLTQWVLSAALRQLAHWRQTSPDLQVAVNVSGRNLAEPEFAHMVLAAAADHDVPPEALHLELTETALITDSPVASEVLQRLCAAGVRLSLDDFGRGYTSLAYLRRLPLSELKIDKAFVMEMDDNPEDAAIVHSVIELGHSLGLEVTAEGVETAAALATLDGFGCDTAQGYFLSRPLASSCVQGWLQEYAGRAGLGIGS